MKRIILLLIIFNIGIFAQTERFRGSATIDKKFTYGSVSTGTYNLAGSTVINWYQGDGAYSVFVDSLATDVDPIYTFSNIQNNTWITVRIYSDGTNSITFPSGILWQGTTNVAPSSLQANSYNIFKFWKAGWMIFGINVGGFKYP